MKQGLSAAARADLFERIAATAIANQAILKCTMAGVPVTTDNVIVFVGDFFEDPETPALQGLMHGIIAAIEEVVEVGESLKAQPALARYKTTRGDDRLR